MPTTLLAIASVGVSAIGAAKQAAAEKRSAEYQADMARTNAIIAEQNATDVQNLGKKAVVDRGLRTRQVIGSARAMASGSGLSIEGGTTTEALLNDLYTAGAVDVLTIHNNAEREARRARVQGTNFTMQAGLFDQQARSINPFFSGLTAGLGSAIKSSDILFPS